MPDMADNKLIGQNYTTPDLVAKVTGTAKYAEDYRIEGMLFAKLLVSPYPHARVKRCDVTAAMAMPGVKAIPRAQDLPGGANARVQGNVWVRPTAPPAAPGAGGPTNSAAGANAATGAAAGAAAAGARSAAAAPGSGRTAAGDSAGGARAGASGAAGAGAG